MSVSAAKEQADVWLDRLGLVDRASDALEKLSHGNQQRVQLAAALLHDPDLLVLDEPFSGLDPTGVDNMKEILSEQTARGAAVLFSSHQLDLVEDVCDDIAIIHDGAIARSGDLAEIRASAALRNVQILGLDNSDWVATAPGVVSHQYNPVSGVHELIVNDDVSAEDLLHHATTAGAITSFSYTPPRRHLSGDGAMSQMYLVRIIARREFVMRVRSKAFLVAMAVTVLVLVGFIVVPALTGDDTDTDQDRRPSGTGGATSSRRGTSTGQSGRRHG